MRHGYSFSAYGKKSDSALQVLQQTPMLPAVDSIHMLRTDENWQAANAIRRQFGFGETADQQSDQLRKRYAV